MASENTSPLLSVRPRSVLASRPFLLRGEDFGFNAWSATEYDRDTDRSCWSPLSGFMQRFRHHLCEAAQANRWLKVPVGSEEARLRASLRPPPKLYVPVSGIQLSRRHVT